MFALIFSCNNSSEDLKVRYEFSFRREPSGASALLEEGSVYGYSPEVGISSCSLPLHHFLHDNHDECPFHFKALSIYKTYLGDKIRTVLVYFPVQSSMGLYGSGT